jgi:hypothetical protein
MNPFQGNQMLQGVGGMISGFFNDSGAPYDAAAGALDKTYNQANQNMQPWMQFGQNAMPKYENALGRFSDSKNYINDIMNNWKMSPWAQHQMDYGIKAANQGAAASGMAGSGAQQKGLADYSQGIASRDMQQWFQNNFGVDQQYLSGLNNQMGYGFNAANSMNQILAQLAQGQSEAAYGAKAARNQDMTDMFAGAAGLAAAFL